ncbi:hypothetical protein EV198_1745 [Roseivirga ehrenbergii]|nr:hypothetical protein EV198_1745 [Roseivirga ehrenbergii]
MNNQIKPLIYNVIDNCKSSVKVVGKFWGFYLTRVKLSQYIYSGTRFKVLTD